MLHSDQCMFCLLYAGALCFICQEQQTLYITLSLGLFHFPCKVLCCIQCHGDFLLGL